MQKIKEYKLPLLKRIAHAYGISKSLFFLIIFLILTLVIFIGKVDSTLGFVTAGISIFFAVMSIINIIRHLHSKASFITWKESQASTSDHVSLFTGPPGTGKTFMEMLAVYYMGKHSWQELQFEYWCISSKLKEGYTPTADEQEIIDAYEFAIQGNGIPCTSTNIPLYSEEYRRYSYEIGAEHLKQEERVPYRTVSALDEMGTICNLELFKDRSNNYCGAADMSDEMRFCRQHCEWRMIGTEQESTNVFKDCRRVVANITKFKGMKKVLKPPILTWIFNKLKRKFIKKMSYRQARRWSRFMLLFKRFLNNTGYFKVTYVFLTETIESDGNSTTTESTRKNGKPYVIYVPCALPIKYNTRVFRESYKAIEKPLRLAVYEKLSLAKEDAKKMLKAETLKAAQEERAAQKREADKQKYKDKIQLKKEMVESVKQDKKSNVKSS